MARRDGGSANLRIESLHELERCRLTLTTLGAQFAQAVESHSQGAFEFVDNMLAARSSPKDWLQDGLALWIQCYKTQADLFQGVCATICEPPPAEAHGRASHSSNGDVTFFLDQFTEATDPVRIGVPVGVIASVSTVSLNDPVSGRTIPAANMSFSVSSDETEALVSLVGLGGLPTPLPAGTYVGTIKWSTGSHTIRAIKE